MYLSYYNLKIKPFQITTDPKFLWMGEKHREALATLQYGIQENKGFLLLTGDVGTGKTALINQLIRKLDIETRVATIPDPGLDKLDFLQFLARQFNMPQNISSKGAFLIKFREFLEEAESKRSKVLLIIDEAQRLNHELIEEIRLLSNIELHDKKLINIFFVGQNEINQLLTEDKTRAVQQRISVRYELKPLTLLETTSYIAHRLQVAGTQRKIFSKGAIAEIFRFSKGNPRLINIICDHALLTGYAKNAKEIASDIISECATELQLPQKQSSLNKEHIKEFATTQNISTTHENQKSRSQIPLSYILIGLLAIFVAGYFLYQERIEPSQQWSAEELVPKSPEVATNDVKETDDASAPKELVAEESDTNMENADINADDFSSGEINANQAQDSQPNQLFDLAQLGKIIIYFNYNSNELPPEAYQTLDRFAATVLEETNITISVNGYTDSAGSPSYNQNISKFRANIIKSYLVGKGIDPLIIEATGFGAADPIAPNDSLEGRKRNRRVEIAINRSAVE